MRFLGLARQRQKVRGMPGTFLQNERYLFNNKSKNTACNSV